jgi:hypothetical protein
VKTFTNIKDFTNALDASKVLLANRLVVAVRKCSEELGGKIRLRVASKGESSSGGAFTAYSSKWTKTKTKHGTPPYGKKIDKKNFYFSGQMWNSFGVRKCSIQGERIVSEIGFTGSNAYKSNEELSEIHDANESQPIAAPSKEEEQELINAIERELYLILDSLL